METLTLTGREQIRLQLVPQVEMGELKMGEAAVSLGGSARQMQRIVAGYRAAPPRRTKIGPSPFAHHGNRRQIIRGEGPPKGGDRFTEQIG